MRDAQGKPVLPIEPVSIYGYGGLIRGAENLLLELFSEGLLSGTTHTCLGQELCQMSVVRALDDPADAVLSNHRNHGHFLTYSGHFVGLIAEIMGRSAGVCGGVGGSQHLAYRHFHSNGVQSGMTGVAVGEALARKRRGQGGVVAVIVGDGTTGEGLLYESLNLASVWSLPLLFVVENNAIAQTTPTAETIGGSIISRGEAFGIQSWRYDDADPEFLQQVADAVGEVRRTKLPGFLVIDTARLGPHSKGDDLRDEAEMDRIRDRDPLRQLGGQLPASERSEIDAANTEFLEAVRQQAEASPLASAQRPRTSIFDGFDPVPRQPLADSPSGTNVRADLNASLRFLLEDERTLLIGEDLHDPYGGAFKVSTGLNSTFADRVISTPISEAGVVGTGVGLSLAGFRPIVEIMFADFLTLGMDQLFNHAVKFPGMYPDVEVPLTVRTPSGGRRGYGPTHSQSPENLVASIPGLTVVFPSRRHKPGELLRRAVQDWPFPTVFFEHKLLYGKAVDSADYKPIESESDPAADLFPTLWRGPSDPDVVLVCYGDSVELAEEAAEKLVAEELEAAIIIPSLIAPFPRRSLAKKLFDKPRIAVIEEAHGEFGFGAELAAVLVENGFQGRFTRIAPPPVPIPAARSLESEVLPDVEAVMNGILKLCIAPTP